MHYKYLLSFYSQLKYFYLLIVKHISFDDEKIYYNFYNYQDKIDHNLINSIVNIDNNIIDITSHLYKKTNNVSIQTNIQDRTEDVEDRNVKEIQNKVVKEIQNEYLDTKQTIMEYDKQQNIFEKLFICNIL